ncbi:MAG TPA: type II toxin-antitoxin system RelE/ParE family toxin [Lacunisphaera sp.]|nr:type II toxin-antitoxin system RelE/ParE family toxin [Lacunisphaera sp.]
MLTFIETATFTRLITGLVPDDEYAAFQQELASHPEKSGPMSGCGGVRKVRLAAGGKGKRGGARVLYLHLPDHQVIYLLYVFTKGDANNLTAAGRQAIRTLAQQIKHAYRA